MLKLKIKVCKCGKTAMPSRRICFYCYLERRRIKAEVAKQKKFLKKTKKVEKDKLSKRNLDALWRTNTKIHYGKKCEVCGSPYNLNSHHVFRRTVYPIRWDYRNCVVLCASHHMFDNGFSAHCTPTLFGEWIRKVRGEKWHCDLIEKSRSNNTDRKHYYEELTNLI